MPHRCDTTDGKPGGCFHKFSIGTPELLTVGTHQRLHLLFIHAAVARGDHQHRRRVGLALEDDAFGDLAKLDAQCISRLLRSASRIIEHHRRMWMTSVLQDPRHTLHAFRQGFEFSAAHQALRLLNNALPARAFVAWPRKSLMNWPASMSLSRSMPVSMPMPCSR